MEQTRKNITFYINIPIDLVSGILLNILFLLHILSFEAMHKNYTSILELKKRFQRFQTDAKTPVTIFRFMNEEDNETHCYCRASKGSRFDSFLHDAKYNIISCCCSGYYQSKHEFIKKHGTHKLTKLASSNLSVLKNQ